MEKEITTTNQTTALADSLIVVQQLPIIKEQLHEHQSTGSGVRQGGAFAGLHGRNPQSCQGAPGGAEP